MHFDELMAPVRTSDQHQSLVIGPDWGQGKTTFGGISVAMIATALRQKVAPTFRLLSLTTSFINPLTPDQTFEISCETIKLGKTVGYLEGKIIQNGQIIVQCFACYGIERDSSIEAEPLVQLDFGSPDTGTPFPYIPKVIPEFTKHVDFRLMTGDFPFQASSSREMGGYMRFREPPNHFSEEQLIALIDTWPPSMLQMLHKPAPASTLTWKIQRTHTPLPENPKEWLGYKATTTFIDHGIGSSVAQIGREDGQLLALSMQTIGIYG